MIKILHSLMHKPLFVACGVLIFIISGFKVSGQNLSPTFNGSLTFEKQFTHLQIQRDSCVGITASETWNIDSGTVTITENILDQRTTYLPVRFIKMDSSIHLICYDTISLKTDTSLLYKLSEKEFCGLQDFRIDDFVSQLKSCRYTYYQKDTMLMVMNTSRECYVFGYVSEILRSWGGPSYTHCVLYVDKQSLFPIQEEVYKWYFERHQPCQPAKYEWLLYSKQTLVDIKAKE